VTLRGASDWVRVEDHIKLWDSLKKEGITVTIKVNWGRKTIEDCSTEGELSEKEEEEEEEEKNKPKRRVYLCLHSPLFSSVLVTNIREQLQ